MRSPHPPKQDRVSHGIRQEESTAHAKASSVDEGRPACAQAPWGRRAQPASAEAGPCLSRNQEQSEPWLDDVVASAPACSQARVRDRTNAERPKRGVETAVAIKDVIVISDETKRWKLSPFQNARSPSLGLVSGVEKGTQKAITPAFSWVQMASIPHVNSGGC